MPAILDQICGSSESMARRLVTFHGRARIVEVLYVGLAISVISLLVKFPLQALSWDWKWLARAAVDTAIFIPFLALFSRRLHDQGLSGWWALLVLPNLPLKLYDSYSAVFAVIYPEWLSQPDPLDGWRLILIPVALAVVVLLLRPGMRGPNRYGPDPRANRELAPA